MSENVKVLLDVNAFTAVYRKYINTNDDNDTLMFKLLDTNILFMQVSGRLPVTFWDEVWEYQVMGTAE